MSDHPRVPRGIDGDDLRDISAGLEAAIDAAEGMFQEARELAIEPKWDLKKSDLRDWFGAIVGHLADGAGDGVAAKLGFLATLSQITDPAVSGAMLQSAPVPDRSIDTKIEWINGELSESGRSPVSAWVSVIPQIPRRDATVTGETSYFLSWHEAALSIARKLLKDRLQNQYTLKSWLRCWSKTKWQRILAGIREERLFLERSNAFVGGDPDDARAAGGKTDPPDPGRYHVTLTQAAATVNRSKRTLERWQTKDKEFPPADVEGGGGKASEWRWGSIRPYLEQKANRELPEWFPADPFRPGYGSAEY